MVYEYFANLNIERIDVDSISEKFSASEFQRGIEFDTSLEEILSFKSASNFEVPLNLPLEDIATTTMSFTF